jgi:hypothetical protein
LLDTGIAQQQHVIREEKRKVKKPSPIIFAARREALPDMETDDDARSNVDRLVHFIDGTFLTTVNKPFGGDRRRTDAVVKVSDRLTEDLKKIGDVELGDPRICEALRKAIPYIHGDWVHFRCRLVNALLARQPEIWTGLALGSLHVAGDEIRRAGNDWKIYDCGHSGDFLYICLLKNAIGYEGNMYINGMVNEWKVRLGRKVTDPPQNAPRFRMVGDRASTRIRNVIPNEAGRRGPSFPSSSYPLKPVEEDFFSRKRFAPPPPPAMSAKVCEPEKGRITS